MSLIGTMVSTVASGVSTGPVTIFTPRHVHLPDIGADSNVFFEALVFMYSAMALGLQYVNLYKTVWWLPHSSANYALVFSQLFYFLLIYDIFYCNAFRALAISRSIIYATLVVLGLFKLE